MCTAPASSDNSVNDGVIDGDGDEDSVSIEQRFGQLKAVEMAAEALGLDHVENVMALRERVPMVNRRRALIRFAQDNGLPVDGLATAPKTVVQSLELIAAIKINESVIVASFDNPQPVSAQDDPNPTRSGDFSV